ncbi:hypothetical protein FACS1894159_03200 [Bacteroidia bacterium]|nr:hypothetical protein FACS1894159_03200 [Bacteroidia bacterium]
MTTQKNARHEATKAPEEAIGSTISKIDFFFEKNAKALVAVLVMIVVAVGGYFSYKYLYAQPRSQKAADMIYVAEQQFAIDSFALALNGDGNNAGFLQVIDKYGSTPQGNVARHYAGVCYLRMGDLDNAMRYLSAYEHSGGIPARMITSQNYGLQGDVLSQRGEYAAAAAKYREAVDASDNSLTTPYYLRKLGLMYTLTSQRDEAVAAYERIQREYPSSMEARDIDKYIGEAQQQ